MARNRRRGKKPMLSKTKIETPDKKVIYKKSNIEKRSSKPESDSEADSGKLLTLLELYAKDKLVELIVDSAIKHPALYDHILEVVDDDATNRNIFVYGLAWNATHEDVRSVFQRFGEIESCAVVKDRATGNSKGYGFVLFKTRKAASKALKEPQKKIGGRMASCQLASLGHGSDAKAKEPKNATNAPVKKNVGAVDPKGKGQVVVQGKVQEQQMQVQPQQAQLLAAVAAAQNFALFNQHPGLNAMYGGFLTNPGGAGFMNPALAGTLGHGSLVPSHSGYGQGIATGTGQLGPMRGIGGSLPGAYALYDEDSMGTEPQQRSLQIGQQLLSRNMGANGSFTGTAYYKWYLLYSMCITLDFSEILFHEVLGSANGSRIINTINFLIEPSFATRKCRICVVCTSLLHVEILVI